MTGLFYGCSSLISSELNKYIIRLSSLSDLFAECTSLKNVTINVQKVEDVSGMFKGCLSLKFLDFSNFNAIEITKKENFFPNEIVNATVVYNSSIFKNITNFIPNEDINFIDINE